MSDDLRCQYDSCLRAENILRGGAVAIQAIAPGPLLVAYAISTITSCTTPF